MADRPVPIEDLPNIEPASLRPIDVAALAGPRAPTHPPRILMLYGSLRTRSYSRFASEEAARCQAPQEMEPLAAPRPPSSTGRSG